MRNRTRVLAMLFITSFVASSSKSQENDYVLSAVSVENTPSSRELMEKALVDLPKNLKYHFIRNHRFATDVSYETNKRITSISFVEDGVSMRSMYENDGNFMELHSYLKPEQMPDDITRLLRRKHYDMKIIRATEIKKKRSRLVCVNLEDEKYYYTAYITDGQVTDGSVVKKGTR